MSASMRTSIQTCRPLNVRERPMRRAGYGKGSRSEAYDQIVEYFVAFLKYHFAGNSLSTTNQKPTITGTEENIIHLFATMKDVIQDLLPMIDSTEIPNRWISHSEEFLYLTTLYITCAGLFERYMGKRYNVLTLEDVSTWAPKMPIEWAPRFYGSTCKAFNDYLAVQRSALPRLWVKVLNENRNIWFNGFN